MLPLENVNYWLCLLFFVIPGMIIFSIRSLFIPIYDKNKSSNIFRFLMYSSWNLFISLLLIKFSHSSIQGIINFNIFSNLKLIILYLFLLPILEGLLWSYINTKKFNHKIVRPFFEKFLHLNIINPAPTAWDSLFHDDKERIIEIVFDDNEHVFAYWGVNSYVSSENNTRDLYLEYTLQKNDDGTFSKNDLSEGILVNETKIKQLKFHKIPTEKDNKIKKFYNECLKIKNENKMIKEEYKILSEQNRILKEEYKILNNQFNELTKMMKG